MCVGFLQKTADLLRVPADELQACLRVRTLRAGKQSVLFKPCSQNECVVRRDCLGKVIYARRVPAPVTSANSVHTSEGPDSVMVYSNSIKCDYCFVFCADS